MRMAITSFALEILPVRSSQGGALTPRTDRPAKWWRAYNIDDDANMPLPWPEIPHLADYGARPHYKRSGAIIGGAERFSHEYPQTSAVYNGAFVNSIDAYRGGSAGSLVYVGSGRGLGRDYLRPSGTFLLTLAALGTNNWEGWLDVSDVSQLVTADTPTELTIGHCGAIEFFDDAADGAALALGRIRSGVATVNGQRLIGCGYAAVGPEATIYIAPEDFGATIPLDVSNNTASAFRNNPTIFLTPKGCANAGGVAVRAVDAVPLTTTLNGQPVGIHIVETAPVRTRWLFCVDGFEFLAYVEHPVGSDIRRPRDIWSQVIVPLLGSGGVASNGARLVDGRGEPLVLDARLSYLDWARYIGQPGQTAQTNTTGGALA